MSGVTHVDLAEVSKGTTVGHPSSDDRDPSSLTTKEKLPEPARKKTKLADVILEMGLWTNLKSKLVEPLTQDLRQRVESRSFGTERTLIQVKCKFGVAPKAPSISDSLKGRINLGINSEPLEAAL
jgi:hypothetical protein